MENEEVLAELLKLNASISAIHNVLVSNNLTTFEELYALEQGVIGISKITLDNVKQSSIDKDKLLDNMV